MRARRRRGAGGRHVPGPGRAASGRCRRGPAPVTISERAIGRTERVLWARVPEAGLAAVVAIHSPSLGAALGGCTLAGAVDSAAAVVTAMRQAESATLAARTAGLQAGGGSIVLLGDPSPRALAALGEVIDRLDGALWLVPDLGGAAAAARMAASHTRFAADPPPADGAASIVAMAHGAWRQATGTAELDGLPVAVLADGPLADEVAGMLAAAGARVVRAEDASGITGPLDLVVSCSPAAITHDQAVDLDCRVAIGAIGDALDSDEVWAALSARGILAVPGSVAGGGLLSAAAALTVAAPARVGV